MCASRGRRRRRGRGRGRGLRDQEEEEDEETTTPETTTPPPTEPTITDNSTVEEEAIILGNTSNYKIDGQYMLVLRKGRNKDKEAKEVKDHVGKATQSKGKVVSDVKIGENLRVVTIKSPAKYLKMLAKNKNIEFIEVDQRIDASDCKRYISPPWHLDRIDQSDKPLNNEFKADGGTGPVNVYVLDTGITYAHPEFAGKAIDGTTKCFWTDPKPCTAGTDTLGHGTHVAGLVIGKKYGVAKDMAVTAISVKIFTDDGHGSTLNLFDGLNWAILDFLSKNKPASIINLSIGGKGPSEVTDRMIAIARSFGMHVIVAAGNDLGDACFRSPARSIGAITVGATDYADSFAWFSNYGSCVNILAPGVGIESASHRVLQGVYSAHRSGTSMACPIVSGVVARFLSKFPTATPDDVEEWLYATASSNKVSGNMPNSPNRLVRSLACPAS